MDDARLAELETTEVDPRARGALLGSALGEQIEVVLASYLALFETSRGLGEDAVRRAERPHRDRARGRLLADRPAG
jgi:hypothetical protein